jgi:hypothetical protein
MILGRDYQIAHSRSAGRIAALIFVEEGEETRFELFKSRLPDAGDHRGQARVGIAQQLSEVALRDGGERGEQLGELGFAYDGQAGFCHRRAWPCATLRKP